MVWVIGIIKFICGAIGVFSFLLFVLVCIATVVYPQFEIENGNEVKGKGENAKYVLAIICAVAFGLLIALA
jgi:hypothetical protein